MEGDILRRPALAQVDFPPNRLYAELEVQLYFRSGVRGMETISMLEFRRDAERIIRKSQQGQRMVLTYRGRPVMRLEPIAEEEEPGADDPFYSIGEIAATEGESLSNEQIDQILYGE